MKFYHVDKLDFWSVYCWLVPVFMITLGVYTFLVCIFGFFTSGSENRYMIAGYAVLLALAFLAQLASIFMAMELRTEVNKNITPTSEIIAELNQVRFWTGFQDESSYRLPGILRSGFIVLHKLDVVYWKSYKKVFKAKYAFERFKPTVFWFDTFGRLKPTVFFGILNDFQPAV